MRDTEVLERERRKSKHGQEGATSKKNETGNLSKASYQYCTSSNNKSADE